MSAVESPEVRVGVISGGAMGSAFAKIAADMGYPVTLYFHHDRALDYFKANYRSERLKGVDLPRSIYGTRRIAEAVEGQNVIFLAVPSEKFPQVVEDVEPLMKNGSIALIGSKGLARVGGKDRTLSQVFLRECKNRRIDHLAVMSGPNKAEQMALHKETGTVIAAYHAETAKYLQTLFHTNYLRVYTEEDVVAIEAWAALKNIMAFGAGILKSQEVSDNTMALYATRALAETVLVGKHLGVEDEMTILGLSGVGDFLLSLIRDGTRNTRAGVAFDQGASLEQLRKSGTLVESLHTVAVAAHLVKENKLNAPIILGLNGMLYEGWSQKAWIQLLMDSKPEREQFKPKGVKFRLARLGMRLFHNIVINGTN